MTQEDSVDPSRTMATNTTGGRKRHHHQYHQYYHGNGIASVESLQCDDRGTDDHSTVTTVASPLSSNVSSIETNLAALDEESIDPGAILESRMLAKLAEQTSYEMQQVVAWWTDSQDKDQEEALPNNMLVRPIDWGAAAVPPSLETTSSISAKATVAPDFNMMLSTDAKSREEALEQSHLVDMAEERTRSMADFVHELNRVIEHGERRRESTDLSVHDLATNSSVESRKRFPLWILFLVPWTVIMLSNRTVQLVPPDRTITLDPPMQETCPAEFEDLLSAQSGDKCHQFCDAFIMDFEPETC
jgi:hypothetical protein